MSVQDKVAGLQGQLDSLKLFAFLVSPNTQHLSFQDYIDQGGTVPEKFREMLYGLAETAKMFGFDADINGDISQMIDDLSPQMMVNILKGLDEETFTTSLKDNPELGKIISSIAAPMLATEVPNMKLSEASTLIGMNVEWGTMGDLTLEVAQNPSALTDSVSLMSDDNTMAFLNSLPTDLQNVVKQGLLEGTEGLDLSGMTLDQAITARAKYAVDQGNYDTGRNQVRSIWAKIAGGSDNAEYVATARQEVLKEIRATLPEHISQTLKTKMADLNSGSAELPEIPPEKLFATLQEKIEDGTLLALLAEDGRMAEIKQQLKDLDNHNFLINLLPDEMKDAALFNKIREGLGQFGLLGPIGGIVLQLASFVLNLVQEHAPRFVGQEKADAMIASLQNIVDPNITPQNVVLPPDPSTTSPAPAPAPGPGTPPN